MIMYPGIIPEAGFAYTTPLHAGAQMTTKRLLLVEDEDHLGFTLQFNLQEEGYHVDWAAHLQQAQAFLAQSEPYDLILLDVMLPDGNGLDWCKHLRQQQNHTPILFLTAKSSPEDIVSGLELGADDYVTKPFALAELLARIKAMLRRTSWHPPLRAAAELDNLPPTFSFGPHSIDFTTHEVLAHGHPVELTHLEFRLLQFFIAHANQVVTREDLLEHVWEVNASNYTRTVDNFLVRLRRIFEKDPTDPKHFLTIRGAGYRFVP